MAAVDAFAFALVSMMSTAGNVIGVALSIGAVLVVMGHVDFPCRKKSSGFDGGKSDR